MTEAALVQCPGWGRECPPYALACLAAYLRREGRSVSLFDLNNALFHAAPAYQKMWMDKDYYSFWENAGQIAAMARESEPVISRFVRSILDTGAPVIGFTTHTTSFLLSLEIAQRIKREDPARLILFGGPQASRAQCAAEFSKDQRVDGVCVGEGEEVLARVLRDVSAGKGLNPMPGLLTRRGGEVVDMGDAELIRDLDSLPYPDYSDFAGEMRGGGGYNNPRRLEIFDSRGCVRKCDFCSEWQYWKRYRFMSGERVFGEMRRQMELHPGVDHFYFIGSLLNGNLPELERFCELMIESGLKATWEGQAIINPGMDTRMLGKMAAAGCRWLGYGVESGSEALRWRINKKFTNDNALATLKATQKAGIKAQINVMFGMPTETRAEFEETLKFLARVRPYIDTVLASQSFCVVDKNTIFHSHPERYGIRGQDHHLFWDSNEGENDYPERFRRYEEFCRLAIFLKLPETSGVLSVKPDKWFLLGSFYAHKSRWSEAIKAFRRSLARESVNKALLRVVAGAYEKAGRKERAWAYLEAAIRLTPWGESDPMDAALRRERDSLGVDAEGAEAAGALAWVLRQRWARTHPRLKADERRMNVMLNDSEFKEGKPVLFSTPKYVTLGTHNACNAKCVFCLEGSYSRFSLDLYKNFFEAKMSHFIRNAEKVTFTGFGEVLWVPGIEEFLDHLNETLPNTEKIFTTNGTPLRPSVIERILKGKWYVLQVSLHASHARLHEELTQLKGQFEQVIGNLRSLIGERDRLDRGKDLHIQLVNIITRSNVGDLPDFLRLAWDLRVQSVRAQYVNLFVPDHIDMSCFFDQERSNREILKARAVLKELKDRNPHRPFEVHLPPLFGEPAEPPRICYDPWQHVYVELQGSALPCCFWGEHIGNLNKGDGIDKIWNGDFYRNLRKGMASGDPHPWCKSCVRYAGFNVNSILCHLTNRPAAQKTILREIVRRGLSLGDEESARSALALLSASDDAAAGRAAAAA